MTAPTKLVISEIGDGQRTYDKPFFVNNDSFPILVNALCFRKSLMKKPGSQTLGQAQRQIGITGASPFTVTISPASILHGVSQFIIGSAILVDGDITGAASATLTSSTIGYSGTLNRMTGALSITIPVIAATPVYYNPGIPALGIERFESDDSPNTQIDFPINVYFDQRYSYEYNGISFYDVSFYKGTTNPVYWSGANYQQFFSSNYYRALFVTNNNPGFHFVSGTYVSGSGTNQIVFTFTSGSTFTLGVNDWLFFNEWSGGGVTINGLSGQITHVAGANYTVTFTGNQTVSGSGIAQMMTSLLQGVGDGIRWYDGDPVFFQGSGNMPSGLGWVNFAPPLDNLMSSSTTYLMGARMILPFGNRLLAIGTYEATSANASSPTYYGNRIRYCEVTSTPFYSAPVPSNNPSNGYSPLAWASNIQGFGGFIDLDTTQRIVSAGVTQGNLILGLEREQRRASNTGIETDPFTIDTINPDYGTSGTFAIIPMDKGILTAGEYGFITTSSYDANRFDAKIIDQIFQFSQNSNGYERTCGARDFVNEVIYFTYFSDSADPNNTFPDTTVVYNYREGSFATWYESYTTYGIFKNSSQQTWPTYFIPWEDWDEKWEDLGADRYSKPYVAAGTPQGYFQIKWSESSFNQPSISIQGISLNGGVWTVTSPNHNLYQGAYLGFWPGPASTSVPKQSFNGSVTNVVSMNQFTVTFSGGSSPDSIVPGVWQISIVDQFDIWSKQFNAGWEQTMKTRLGTQRYFLDTTTFGEFALNIYGSQSTLPLDANPSALAIFSSIVRTRPDDSLGLNDSASSQTQNWHRLSSSAIGDTVQLQMTLTDAEILAVNSDGTPNVEIGNSPWVLYSIIIDLYPSRILS